MNERDPEGDDDELEQRALDSIEAYRAFLDTPAFQHNLDVAVLTKIAGDEKNDIRERRRAAEVLAKLRLQAMEALSELTGAREVALDRLGLKPGPQSLALTQVNQSIEIVRAKDWRAASSLESEQSRDDAALPRSAAPESNGHGVQGPLKPSENDGEDPPA